MKEEIKSEREKKKNQNYHLLKIGWRKNRLVQEQENG